MAIGFHRTPSSNPYLRYGTETSFADFDQSYDAINGMEAPTASRYAVRTGDTLQSIAAAIWGDGALWYVLAEANGLTASSHLAEGMVLTIPNKIVNVHNNATTFRPYNPNMMIGEVNPQGLPPQPKPPKEPGGCARLGQMIVTMVAVAVTVWVAPWATGYIGGALAGSGTIMAGVLGGAVAGAAGSIVSQGVGLAIGVQDQFSWGAVGMAALGGAISGGIAKGALNKIPGMDSVMKVAGKAGDFGVRAVSGAMGNAITQGLGVATGLQERFDWTGVAVSGIMSGVGGWVSDNIDGAGFRASNGEWVDATFGNQMVSGMAGAVAGATAASVLNGSNFGDNLMTYLPNAIASTVGNALAGAVNGQNARNADMRQRLGLDSSRPRAAPEGFIPFDESKLVSVDDFDRTPPVAMEIDRNPILMRPPTYRVNSDGSLQAVTGPSASDPKSAYAISRSFQKEMAWASESNGHPIGNTYFKTGSDHDFGVYTDGKGGLTIFNLTKGGSAQLQIGQGRSYYIEEFDMGIEVAGNAGFVQDKIAQNALEHKIAIENAPYAAAVLAAPLVPLMAAAAPGAMVWGTTNSMMVAEITAGVAGDVGLASASYGVYGVGAIAAGSKAYSISDDVVRAARELNFPPNHGFVGGTEKMLLDVGSRFDRYGGTDVSKFFSPVGTSASARSLPPGVADQPMRTFEVIKPFTVESGTVAPWFGQPGLGTQYRSSMTLSELLKGGYVKEITK